jgi:hypothetical protein
MGTHWRNKETNDGLGGKREVTIPAGLETTSDQLALMAE